MGGKGKAKGNATSKSKDGPARELARQLRIRESKKKKEDEDKVREEQKRKEEEQKRKEQEQKWREEEQKWREEEEKRREEEEKREKKRKEEKEKRMMERDEARFIEKELNKKQFGMVTYLVIEFPKGGNIQLYHTYLSCSCLFPPCMVKGIYVNRDAQNISDKFIIDGYQEMRNIFFRKDNRIIEAFLALKDYDEDLLEFLVKHMANMCEWVPYARGDAKEREEWCISYYWRLEYLKHGQPHHISELDFYWKIYDLYNKVPVDEVLRNWWVKLGYEETEMSDVMMVMACSTTQISSSISFITGHSPAIFLEGTSRGLRQIHIPFDCDENFIGLPTPLGTGWTHNEVVYV